MILFALVFTNLISWKQSADLFAKIRDVDPEFVQEGVASWYGPGFQGRKTANGERFDTHEMTAAHKTLPFNTIVKVTNLDNGVSTIVRINDRGPYIRGRIIDLSNAAKNEIQMGGLADVRIEVIDPEETALQEAEEEAKRQAELENNSPVNLFEDVFPATSKIFVEWNKDTANYGDITDNDLNQIFESSKIRIKVLTPDVEDVSAKIYEEISANDGFNLFEITRKIKFITGYSILVAEFTDRSKASDMIETLESNNFNNIFLEEIINSKNTTFKVYAGNYATPGETKDDIVKLLGMDYNLKAKIVKIGQ